MDGATGSKSSTYVQNVVCLRLTFLEVHILTTTYQKVFMFGLNVPCMVGSQFITLDPWVPARVVVEAKN